MEDETEKQSRILLRPWLENMLESSKIHGLMWHDKDKTMFRVPWKHRSKKDWSVEHCSVFVEWAKNTGRWSEDGGSPNFAQLKTRLRCAFNKAPDIEEVKELHCNYGEEPYKVYRFKTRKDVCLRKTRHKAALSNSFSHLQRRPAAADLLRKFEDVQEESYITENSNSNEGLGREIFFVNVSKQNGNSVIDNGTALELLTSNLVHMSGSYGTDNQTYKRHNAQPDAEVKQPCIPLSVELLSASCSDTTGSARDSPVDEKAFDMPYESVDIGNTTELSDTDRNAEEEEIVSCKNLKPDSVLNSFRSDVSDDGRSVQAFSSYEGSLQQLPSNEHMLQVASLFVEAGEKITRQNTSTATVHADKSPSGSDYQNFIIITPNDDRDETEPASVKSQGLACNDAIPFSHNLSIRSAEKFHEGDGYSSGSRLLPDFCKAAPAQCSQLGGSVIDLTCKSSKEVSDEPIDLTRKGVATQIRTKGSPIQLINSSSLQPRSEEESSKELLNSVIEDIDSEDFTVLPTDTVETLQMKARRCEQFLLSKAKMLGQWEERLKQREAELKATEAACYWKNKFLEAELAKKGVFVGENQECFQSKPHKINDLNTETQIFKENLRQPEPRPMLPVKGFQRTGTEMQPFFQAAVIPAGVHSLSKSTTNIKLAENMNSFPPVLTKGGTNVIFDNQINFNLSSSDSQAGKRALVAIKAANSSSGNDRLTKVPAVGSIAQSNILKVGAPVQVRAIASDVIPAVQVRTIASGVIPPVLFLVSNSNKANADNQWSNSKVTICNTVSCLRQVVTDAAFNKDQQTTDSDLQRLKGVRNPSETASETIIPLSVSSFSAANASPVIDESTDSVVVESTDKTVKNSRYSPIGNISTSNYTAVCDDSDCESGLVIQTSDEEEVEEEEEKKKEKDFVYPNDCVKLPETHEDLGHEHNEQTKKSSSVMDEVLMPKNSAPSEDYVSNCKFQSFFVANQKYDCGASIDSGSFLSSGGSLEEFREWLRHKTRTICKEESSKTETNNSISLEIMQLHSKEMKDGLRNLQEVKSKRKPENIERDDCCTSAKKPHCTDS